MPKRARNWSAVIGHGEAERSYRLARSTDWHTCPRKHGCSGVRSYATMALQVGAYVKLPPESHIHVDLVCGLVCGLIGALQVCAHVLESMVVRGFVRTLPWLYKLVHM